MREIRLGIIGIGGMGSQHALSVSSGLVEGLKLVAVADSRKERLKWATDNLPEDVKQFANGEEIGRASCRERV